MPNMPVPYPRGYLEPPSPDNICYLCEGRGVIYVPHPDGYYKEIGIPCLHCKGEGTYDPPWGKA